MQFYFITRSTGILREKNNKIGAISNLNSGYDTVNIVVSSRSVTA